MPALKKYPTELKERANTIDTEACMSHRVHADPTSEMMQH